MPNKEDVLRALGCVVKGKFGSLQEDCSVSGILLSAHQGIILSHGSILTELCLKDKILFSKVTNGNIIRGSDLKESEFEALIDKRWASCCFATHASPSTRELSYSLSEPDQHPADSVSFTALKCVLLYAFRNEEFFRAVARIMPSSSWTFMDSHEDTADLSSSQLQKETTDIDESSVCFNLLSYFLLLKIESQCVNSQNNNTFSTLHVPLLQQHNYHIGDVAEIVATPFGNQSASVFFNSYSRGVVCNVNGTQGCWILTDARCIPGSEGAPLYTRKENQASYLTGIIAASLCWKNKEWVGFSIACSLSSIYRAFDFHQQNKQLKLRMDSQEWTEKRLSNGLFLHMEDTVASHESPLLSTTVLVKVGSTWGSGVILNKRQGIIITCSHVIQDSHSFDILIKHCQGSPQYKATVIYRNSGSLHSPYDIAVIKCPEATAGIHYEVPKISIPKLGEKVYVVGHALFNIELNLQPSLCAGVISKVISFNSQPVMLQSTCAVHPGASGGPLLNSQGHLVGIVVCNIVDKGRNSCYPHINMSIPAISVYPALYQYLQTEDSSVFSTFKITDPSVKKLWALENSVLDGAEHLPKSRL